MVEPKPKGLCIATRCASVEDFVARFHPFCDETSIFVTTNITRPVGTESQFAILLADKTPVLRGWCIVFEAWADANNPYNRPGMRLGVHRLTVSSKTVMEELLATRRAALAAGKPLVQQTQPIRIEKLDHEPRTATMIGLPVVREPKRPVTVKIPAIGDRAATPRTITGAVPVIAMPRTESRKIAIPSIRPKTEMAQPVMRAPAPPAQPKPVPEPPVVEPLLLDGPTERMSTPPVHVASMGLAEVVAPAVIEPPPPPPRVLAVGTSPPSAVVAPPIEIAEGSAGFGKPVLVEEKRTPGSDMILPANPLMDLTDASLEGFVDCKLFEATQPPAPAPTPTPTPAPAPMPVPLAPQQSVALPEVSLQSTDWRMVMLMVLIALGTAFGISYGVASWAQQRAAAAHHAQ